MRNRAGGSSTRLGQGRIQRTKSKMYVAITTQQQQRQRLAAQPPETTRAHTSAPLHVEELLRYGVGGVELRRPQHL